MTKTSLQNGLPLLLCAVGICVSYLYYGMIQEELFSDGAKVGASFLLLTQCITNTVVALLWQRLDHGLAEVNTKQPTSMTAVQKLPHPLLIMTSFCYFVAMAASNEALHYVTYPTAVLAKSSKLIPTMILTHLVERRQYSIQEWFAAACITLGVVFFNISRNTNPIDVTKENSVYGIVLLLLSLLMDGLLGACQGLLKQQDAPPTATETMLYVNLYAILFFIPVSIYTNEWKDGIELVLQDTTFRQNIVWLNVAAAMGQIFIFLTITWYSSLVCTTITTTRKFFTILLSVLHFGHVFTALQWTSVLLVFCGLYTGIISNATQQVSTRIKKE